DRLAVQLLDADGNLRVTNICAEPFVKLLLGLLDGQARHGHAAYQRYLDIAVAVDACRLVCRFLKFRFPNFALVMGSKSVSRTYLAITVHLRLAHPRS